MVLSGWIHDRSVNGQYEPLPELMNRSGGYVSATGHTLSWSSHNRSWDVNRPKPASAPVLCSYGTGGASVSPASVRVWTTMKNGRWVTEPSARVLNI